ncbi:2Fe-2S iron-sulfur cluster-binding protein [Plesiocystis pacifica]|nr:2Fe-2S iron-sulfur cluster-binding protein [Plesiocystis pacifica]
MDVPRGTTLLAAASRAGAPLGNACRGRGVCRACAVVPITGAEHLSAATDEERRFGLEAPWRMACLTRVDGDGEVVLWTPNWGGWPDGEGGLG